jgi:hypothetical protein
LATARLMAAVLHSVSVFVGCRVYSLLWPCHPPAEWLERAGSQQPHMASAPFGPLDLQQPSSIRMTLTANARKPQLAPSSRYLTFVGFNFKLVPRQPQTHQARHQQNLATGGDGPGFAMRHFISASSSSVSNASRSSLFLAPFGLRDQPHVPFDLREPIPQGYSRARLCFFCRFPPRPSRRPTRPVPNRSCKRSNTSTGMNRSCFGT